MLFLELMNEGRRLYKLVADKKAEMDEADNSLKKQVVGRVQIYSNEYLQKAKEKHNQEFEKVRTNAATEFYGMVQTVVSEKRVALNKMLTDAPSTDQVNLLTALQMRGDSIEADEIKSVALQLLGNYQALHTLQVMADKIGIRIHFPAQYDYQELTVTLNRAEKYLNDMFHDLDNFTETRLMGFNAKAFFHVYPDGDTPEQTYTDRIYVAMADILDGNGQITPEITTESRKLTDAEKAVVESLFSGVNHAALDRELAGSTVAASPELNSAMARIMNSPELLALVRLHPVYGKLLK